jgi:hypothetical protein
MSKEGRTRTISMSNNTIIISLPKEVFGKYLGKKVDMTVSENKDGDKTIGWTVNLVLKKE